MIAFPFWPHTGSAYATRLDELFIGLLAAATLVLVLVFGLIIVFAARYRAGSTADRSDLVKKSWHWEVGWTGATLAIFLGLFFWGAELYAQLYRPPTDALDVYVVGKQWMWKIEHPDGQAEIDELHVPVGRPVRLVMTSQDVIHSFFVPAFRIKHDVLPGRYEFLWFTASEPGDYPIFCAEFCGTDHAHMGGRVIAMAPADFEAWLKARGPADSIARQGEALFRNLGCSGCHGGHGTVHAPPLEGLFGKSVPLQDGRIVTADERYLRDSILLPKSEIAAGYDPVMPSFSGQVDEDQILKLIAYIKSLADRPPRRPTP